MADAGHHQLVELDGDDVIRRIGTGRRGAADDPPEFAEPNGLALLPNGDIAVADTANHVVRIVHTDGHVSTLDLPAALRGQRTITGDIPAVLSPWDVAWWPALGRLVVAAAGVHLLLSVDPASGETAVLAGTTVEGLRDGPALDGWLAQPSGLAVDGDRIWFVDAETSALRYLTIDGELHTAVGEGLFDFGHVDGPAQHARFQHPLGVTLLADGSVAVLDTYNGAVRRYDPASDTVSTLARDLLEPSGAVLVDGDLVVVESAAHRLVRPVPRSELVSGVPERTTRPVSPLAPGAVTLAVRFTPAPGTQAGRAVRAVHPAHRDASPPQLLRARRRRVDRAHPRAGAGRQRRGRAAGDRTGGLLRRGRRAPGLLPGPAGLGRADPHRRRRPGQPRPHPARLTAWPRRPGTTGDRDRTHLVRIRWSLLGPVTSHSTRSR